MVTESTPTALSPEIRQALTQLAQLQVTIEAALPPIADFYRRLGVAVNADVARLNSAYAEALRTARASR